MEQGQPYQESLQRDEILDVVKPRKPVGLNHIQRQNGNKKPGYTNPMNLITKDVKPYTGSPKNQINHAMVIAKPKTFVQSSANYSDLSGSLMLKLKVEQPQQAFHLPLPSIQQSCVSQSDTLETDTIRLTEAFHRIPNYTGFVILNEQVVSGGMLNQMMKDRQICNIQVIDKGSFGTAYKVMSKEVSEFIIKEVPRKKGVDFQEILTPLALRKHPGIVKVVAVMCWSNVFSIVMQDAGPSLRSMMTRPNDSFRRFMTCHFMELTRQAFETGRYLESQHLCHRDIKPENFCVSELPGGYYRLVLIDFGSCQSSRDVPKYAAHTHEFQPPKVVEVIFRRLVNMENVDIGNIFFTEHADAWAIAMTLLWIKADGRHMLEDVNRYSDVPEIMEQQRKNVMVVIMHLEDHWCDQFLSLFLPDVKMNTVFSSVLRVDTNKRWNCTRVCDYLAKEGKRKTNQEMKIVIASKQPRMSNDQEPPKATAKEPEGFDFSEFGLKNKPAQTAPFMPQSTVMLQVPNFNAVTTAAKSAACNAMSSRNGFKLHVNPMDCDEDIGLNEIGKPSPVLTATEQNFAHQMPFAFNKNQPQVSTLIGNSQLPKFTQIMPEDIPAVVRRKGKGKQKSCFRD